MNLKVKITVNRAEPNISDHTLRVWYSILEIKNAKKLSGNNQT